MCSLQTSNTHQYTLWWLWWLQWTVVSMMFMVWLTIARLLSRRREKVCQVRPCWLEWSEANALKVGWSLGAFVFFNCNILYLYIWYGLIWFLSFYWGYRRTYSNEPLLVTCMLIYGGTNAPKTDATILLLPMTIKCTFLSWLLQQGIDYPIRYLQS